MFEDLDEERENISFHEGYPCVNVKYYKNDWANGIDDDLAEVYFQQVQEWFMEQAAEIAHSFGYSGIFSFGRNGGWIAPFRQFTKSGKSKFYPDSWPGQGGDLGYPSPPPLEDPIELFRFQAFERAIKEVLMAEVDQELKNKVKEHDL